MKTILFIAAVLAVTQGSTSPPSTGGHTDNSLLYNLLQVAGFSESCVSGMLDTCSPVPQGTHVAPVIQGGPEVQGLKAEVQELREMLQQVTMVINKSFRPRNCKDLLENGDTESGQRKVYPYSGRPNHWITVYCDQDVDGGGWTVFQRRVNNTARIDFYRNWTEYETGFGNVNGEFWLGLDILHQLTTSNQELRIDLYDYEGEHRWAKYGTFQVDSADTNYRLTVERYQGDAGDSMADHNGQEFTTHDADHDVSTGNCALERQGGWWYKWCSNANLNGYQYVGANSPHGKGITWYHWRGNKYSLMRTTMMVRPAL